MEKTDQATTKAALDAYYRDNLIGALDRLVVHHDIPGLSEMFSDFIYFLNNPDVIEDFEKKSILDRAVECVNLLGNLSNVYEKFEEYKANTK